MSRYIKSEDAIKAVAEYTKDCFGTFEDAILNAEDVVLDSVPSIDIVRCQDCKYWVYNFNGCSRNPCTEPWYATDGCTYGERNDG